MTIDEGRGVSVDELESGDGGEPSEEELLQERLKESVIRWCEEEY